MREDHLTDILAECLEAIERGERTLAECLAMYPEHREELSALLSTVATVKAGATYAPRPNFRLSSRARLLRRLPARPAHQPRPSLFKRMLPVGLTLTLLITSLLGVGTVYAASESLPGDALYPVKLSVEDARLFLADDTADVALASEFAQERVEEIQALVRFNRAEDLELAVELFSGNVTTASDSLEAVAQTDPELAAQLGAQFEQALSVHTEKLNQLLNTAPEAARPAIENAILASNRGRGALQQLIERNQPGGPPDEVIPGPPQNVPGGPPDEHPNPGANPPGGGPPEDVPGNNPNSPGGPPTRTPGNKP